MDERFDVYGWRDGAERGEPRGTFPAAPEAIDFSVILSRLPRPDRPNFVEVIHHPSGQMVSYHADHWGGSDDEPPPEPALTFESVPAGLQIRRQAQA